MFRNGDIIVPNKQADFDEKLVFYKVISSRKVHKHGLIYELVTFKRHFLSKKEEQEENNAPWGNPFSIYRDEPAKDYQLMENASSGHPYTKIFS